MIVYYSGGGVRGVWREVNELLIRSDCARLLSFAYRRLLFDYCDLVRDLKPSAPQRIMIDSGAFSAWSKGDKVSLDALSHTIDALIDKYEAGAGCCTFVAVNLDVIPGRKGVDPTPQELVESMRQSQENYEVLKARFPNNDILPVFHQGEPREYYHELCSQARYVCLSPRNDLSEKHRITWSREFANSDHARGPRDLYGNRWEFHGLAATGHTMMTTVNWHSVDSAAWVMVGGMGAIMWRNARGKLVPLVVSDSSRALKTEDAHFDTLPPAVQQNILKTITERGYSIEELRRNDRKRYMWNIDEWRRIEGPRVYVQQGGLFDEPSAQPRPRRRR